MEHTIYVISQSNYSLLVTAYGCFTHEITQKSETLKYIKPYSKT